MKGQATSTLLDENLTCEFIWRAFPVNIQTTLLYDTSIKFLCHIFYFLSVYFLFCFFIFHFASIFFISLPINLYIPFQLISFIFYSLYFICVLYSLYFFHFFSFRVRFFIFFLISMQHVITLSRRTFPPVSKAKWRMELY